MDLALGPKTRGWPPLGYPSEFSPLIPCPSPVPLAALSRMAGSQTLGLGCLSSPRGCSFPHHPPPCPVLPNLPLPLPLRAASAHGLPHSSPGHPAFCGLLFRAPSLARALAPFMHRLRSGAVRCKILVCLFVFSPTTIIVFKMLYVLLFVLVCFHH